MATSVTLNAKVYKPCKKLVQVLKLKLKKPIIAPLLAFRKLGQIRRRRGSSRGWLSWFKRLGRGKKKVVKEDQVGELMSFSEMGTHEKERLLFPSPLTPAYVKAAGIGSQSGMEGMSGEAVEDACRSFENYLVEMIVEEGKVTDLNDVEELLYCWRNLKCPVFHELVCKFYGELCMDLFSNEQQNDETQELY